MYVVRHPIDEIWAPVSYGSGGALTLYMGQLVTTKSGSSTIISSGAVNMIAAAGASDTTGKIVPFGVVCGTNNFDPKIFDTATTGVETITSANTPALQVARNFRGVEGAYPKNDPRAFVRISLIGPSTILWDSAVLGDVGYCPDCLYDHRRHHSRVCFYYGSYCGGHSVQRDVLLPERIKPEPVENRLQRQRYSAYVLCPLALYPGRGRHLRSGPAERVRDLLYEYRRAWYVCGYHGNLWHQLLHHRSPETRSEGGRPGRRVL